MTRKSTQRQILVAVGRYVKQVDYEMVQQMRREKYRTDDATVGAYTAVTHPEQFDMIVQHLREDGLIRNPQGQTDTPAFKRWFGNSKVVDSNGDPLVVYHGTYAGGFSDFSPSSRDPHHVGFFFTDSVDIAKTYAGSKQEVIPAMFERKRAIAKFNVLNDVLEFCDSEDNKFYSHSVNLPMRVIKLKLEETHNPIRGWEWRLEELTYNYRTGTWLGTLNEYLFEQTPRGEERLVEAANRIVSDRQIDERKASISGIYDVYLSMQTPLEVDAHGDQWNDIKSEDVWKAKVPTSVKKDPQYAKKEAPFLQHLLKRPSVATDWLTKYAKGIGCDGCIIRNCIDTNDPEMSEQAADIYVVFEPTQIKSVKYNVGTFDPSDPDIRHNPRRNPRLVANPYKEKILLPSGNVQYVYSEQDVAKRHAEKAQRIEQLKTKEQRLRSAVKRDTEAGDPVATAVALIMATYERVGNNESAAEGHFGVTGWQARHFTREGSKYRIDYVGKSGVEQTKVIDQTWLVQALAQHLRKKRKNERVLPVSASTVNRYLEEYDVSAKDLRGYGANTEMQKELTRLRKRGPALATLKPKDVIKTLKAEFNAALTVVASKLGHTTSVLRKQYLVPALEPMYTESGAVLRTFA